MVNPATMFSRRAEGRLEVQVPTAAQDHPSWTKVGVLAALGFLVGIAWPRLVGVRLGPAIPADIASAMASASGAPPAPEPSSPPPSAPAMAAVPAATTTAPAPPPVRATVSHGVVFACRTADGDTQKGSDCGALPGLDGLVMPRLRKLAECPAAAGAAGKLHLVAHSDFGRGTLFMDLGKGNGASAEALLACARADVAGVALAGVTHDNPRYSVAYTVTLDAGGDAAAAPAPSSSDTASDTAQIAWDVAIVRDAPKTGKVLARLQRGATVRVGPAKDGWYPVKFGDGFGSDGWLYRGALGR